MTQALLQWLNKTPGALGCAYVDGDTLLFDMGEAIGGESAVPLARRAAEAFWQWFGTDEQDRLESATFVGHSGRLVAQAAGGAVLVAFAENEASAGLLRVRMRALAGHAMELAAG